VVVVEGVRPPTAPFDEFLLELAVVVDLFVEFIPELPEPEEPNVPVWVDGDEP